MAICSDHPDLLQKGVADSGWTPTDARPDNSTAHNAAANPDATAVSREARAAGVLARLARRRLGLSQREFSDLFFVPVGTLRDWEQGRKQSDRASLAYLQVINHDPQWVMRALRPPATPEQ
jgi:putative transcriptional regulator